MFRRSLFGSLFALTLLAGSASAEPVQVRLPPPPAGLPAPPPLPGVHVTRHRATPVRRAHRRAVVVRHTIVRHHRHHTRRHR